MARRGRVDVDIVAHADGVRRGVADAETHLSRLNRVGSSALRGLGVAAVSGAAAGFTALAFATKAGIDQQLDQEKVSARTANVLKTTGGAANVTKAQVEALASSIQDLTGTADDQVQAAENMLLTFTNVRNEVGRGNDVFNRATKAVNDLSVGMDQDLQASAIQVGKALNDPIKGVTALQRVGVSFTKQQKDQIKTLVDSGRTLDAQKIILRELNREFGGAAASQGRTTESVQRLQRRWEDMTQVLGRKVLPVVADVVDAFVRHMPQIERVTRQVFTAIQRYAGQAMAYYRENIAPTIAAIVSAARALWARFGGDVKAAFALVRGVVAAALKIVGALITGFLAVLRGDWGTAWNSLKTVVSTAMSNVAATLKGAVALLGNLALDIGRAIAQGIVSGLGDIGGAIRSKVMGGLSGIGSAIKGAVGLDFSGPNFALRRVGAGTSTDLTRIDAGGSRAADAARRGAEDSARARGADDSAAARAGDRAYDQARLATINRLTTRILTRRGVLVKKLAKFRSVLMKTKVPRGAGKQAALDRRAQLVTAINGIEDELETIAANYYDLQNEAANLGADIAAINRADEAATTEEAAAADTSSSAAEAGSPPAITADAQAQIEQANTRAATAQRAADIGAAFIRTAFGSSSIDPASGSVVVNINALHPGDPDIQAQVARWMIGALGGQGSVPASTFGSAA